MCEQNEFSKYFQILQQQNIHNAEEIEEAYDYIKLNFMEINMDTRLYQLNRETFKNILSSDYLCVDTEDTVFANVKMYLEYNLLNPLGHLYDLLLVVRLPLLSTKYLMHEVEPLANSNFNSRPLFLEALHYHFFPDERDKIPSYRTTPRNSTEKMMADDMIISIGNCCDTVAGILEVYSRSRDEWTVYKDYQLSIKDFAVAMIDNRLMLIGGHSIKADCTVDTVFSINLDTGVLSSESPLSETKCNIAAVTVGIGEHANLYAIGGTRNNQNSNAIERWDPITRKWSLMSPMANGRKSCAVVVFDEKIYVAGGSNGLKSMDMYDPKTDIWTHVGVASKVGGYCSAASTKEYIFLIGGYPEQFGQQRDSTIERYHPKTNTWSIIGSIDPNGVRSLVTIGDKIIAAGGHQNDRNVEEFDTVTEKWKPLAMMFHGREYGTLVVATLEDAIKK